MGDDLSDQLVDGINATYGSHAGHRAVHAKGVLCAATFTPTDSASALSRAPHFAGPPVRAHVRFSNGGGDPSVPDSTRDARGMAVKFYLPAGGTTDIVALSLPVFFARTPEDLLAFNVVRRPDPATGQPNVEKVGAYLAEHAEAVAAVTAAISHPTPASYAGLTYHSMHAFGFVAADDSVRYGRYHLVPEGGEQTISEEEAAAKPPDYLREELAARFERGPAAFGIEVHILRQSEGQLRLRRNIHPGPACQHLRARACRAARDRADGRALRAARNRADHCARQRSATNILTGALVLAQAFFAASIVQRV